MESRRKEKRREERGGREARRKKWKGTNQTSFSWKIPFLTSEL